MWFAKKENERKNIYVQKEWERERHERKEGPSIDWRTTYTAVLERAPITRSRPAKKSSIARKVGEKIYSSR